MKLFFYGLFFFLTACVSSAPTVDLADAARLNTQLGVAYLNEHQYPRAITKLRLALTQNSKDAETWFALGDAYLLMRDYPEALSALQKAEALAPERLDIQNNLAVVECKLGKTREAQQRFLSLAHNPQYFDQKGALENAKHCH